MNHMRDSATKMWLKEVDDELNKADLIAAVCLFFFLLWWLA